MNQYSVLYLIHLEVLASWLILCFMHNLRLSSKMSEILNNQKSYDAKSEYYFQVASIKTYKHITPQLLENSPPI